MQAIAQNERVAAHFFVSLEEATKPSSLLFNPDERAGYWLRIVTRFDSGNLVCFVPNPPPGYETEAYPQDVSQHWPYLRIEGGTTIYERTGRRILDTGALVLDLKPLPGVVYGRPLPSMA